MPRLRCSECQRLVIAEPEFHNVETLKAHVVLLLQAAREFDQQTPAGEHYSAVDFIDALDLSVSGPRSVKPAGNPGNRKPSAAA